VKQLTHPEQFIECEHTFAEQDVLTHPYHIELRKDTIYLAMVLGNNYGKKVQMQVHTVQEKIEIHGTVLALNEEHVFLTGGIKIPIRAISEVKVY
jgi:hypothetical protein